MNFVRATRSVVRPARNLNSIEERLSRTFEKKKYKETLRIFQQNIFPRFSETANGNIMGITLTSIYHLSFQDSSKTLLTSFALYNKMMKTGIQLDDRSRNVLIHNLSRQANWHILSAQTMKKHDLSRYADCYSCVLAAHRLFKELDETNTKVWKRPYSELLMAMFKYTNDIEGVFQMLNPKYLNQLFEGKWHVHDLCLFLGKCGFAPPHLVATLLDIWKNQITDTQMIHLSSHLVGVDRLDILEEFVKQVDTVLLPVRLELEFGRGKSREELKRILLEHIHETREKSQRTESWKILFKAFVKVPLSNAVTQGMRSVRQLYGDMLTHGDQPNVAIYFMMMDLFSKRKIYPCAILLYNKYMDQKPCYKLTDTQLKKAGLFMDISEVDNQDAFIVNSLIDLTPNLGDPNSYSVALAVLIDTLGFAGRPQLGEHLLKKFMANGDGTHLDLNCFTSLVEAFGRNKEPKKSEQYLFEGIRFVRRARERIPPKLIHTFLTMNIGSVDKNTRKNLLNLLKSQ